MADAFRAENWHDPRTVLAECGVTPEEVTDIFITHAHFDHMGGTDHFPNARFYVQERELSNWVWAMSLDQKFRWLMLATDPGDILRTVDLACQGRLVCIDGDREDVLPGIDLQAAMDTHTWGSMYVTVRNTGRPNAEDSWVLAGDLTGAADCAIAFARHGVASTVSWNVGFWNTDASGEEVHAFDTGSRRMTAAAAAARHGAFRAAHHGPAVRLFKKIDSTLRGQPAAELAETMRVLRQCGRDALCVVTPAFHATGHATEDGHIRLYGQALEDTALWARDHNYLSADLVRVLGAVGLRV